MTNNQTTKTTTNKSTSLVCPKEMTIMHKEIPSWLVGLYEKTGIETVSITLH